MTTVPPLPPFKVHSTTRLTHAQAHEQLSTFLAAAQNDPAYRPDSVLTDRGPQSASTTAGSNLVLAHLDRIRRGIAGERIGGGEIGIGLGVGVSEGRGRKRKFEEENAAGDQDGYSQLEEEGEGDVVVRTVEEQTEEGGEVALEVEGEGDGWVDKDDYELAQEDGIDEGTRADEAQPGAVDVSEQPGSPEEARDQMRVASTAKSETDKKARKAAKAARRKEEKKLREAEKIAR